MVTVKQIALIVSRDLRKNQTPAEKAFWNVVKDKKYLGFKFLRQHPLFNEFWGQTKFFIADFYCSKLKLLIEIDGGVHEQQPEYDKIRSEIINIQKDIIVIRFKNEEVLYDIDCVMLKLRNGVKSISKEIDK